MKLWTEPTDDSYDKSVLSIPAFSRNLAKIFPELSCEEKHSSKKIILLDQNISLVSSLGCGWPPLSFVWSANVPIETSFSECGISFGTCHFVRMYNYSYPPPTSLLLSLVLLLLTTATTTTATTITRRTPATTVTTATQFVVTLFTLTLSHTRLFKHLEW